MQNWEYLFVDAENWRDVQRPHTVNGQKLPNWEKGPSIYEYADLKGAQGWELIAAPYTPTSLGTGRTSYRLVFNRPKP